LNRFHGLLDLGDVLEQNDRAQVAALAVQRRDLSSKKPRFALDPDAGLPAVRYPLEKRFPEQGQQPDDIRAEFILLDVSRQAAFPVDF
jgi:hypothetical protein